MICPVRWTTGGDATLLSIEGEVASFRSDVPSPPGSRLTGEAHTENITLRLKVHTCRRRDDGAYLLQGRLLDMTRDERLRLARDATG